MAENDLTALEAWLRSLQGVTLERDRLREPAGLASHLSALANAADTTLPFGAEPSGFTLAQIRLVRGGDKA